jgi:hypothetical protein
MEKVASNLGKSIISTVDLPVVMSAYVSYSSGNIAQQANPANHYAYVAIEDAKPGDKYYFNTTLRSDGGIVAYDHEYLVKSWNHDDRIRLSNGKTVDSINAASLSTGYSVEELRTILSTATLSDSIHYVRVEYPYSEYISIDPSTRAYAIEVPKNATRLLASNLQQNGNTLLSVACDIVDYSSLANRVSTIENAISEESF